MISFKGILKYSIYMFIAGWMFLLGIMVGRGTAPVNFDTHTFQKRLETIANEFGKKKGSQEKINLKFYDVLDSPVPEESVAPQKAPLEIIPRKEMPKKETNEVINDVPLKTSKKKQTFKQAGQKIKPDPPPGKINTPPVEESIDNAAEKGKYTIQIAAYKDFPDAVSQMAALEKKGVTSYRVKGQKDGITWYRVRTGSFATYDAAKKFNEKLIKAGIKAMIIKKETYEDING